MNTIEELIEDLKNGKMILLCDDEDRENEGDLVLAADFVTPQAVNFMATEARGLICLALTTEQIERLKLPLMVRDEQNFSPNKTAFTVSIEASFGVTTGISAADRAHTVRVASRLDAKPTDIHTPGHIFPIRAQQGGVLKRAGHTEGSVDLAKLAGCTPAAVICEVMNPDGTMARIAELKKFAEKHNIKIGTIVDLIEYRLSRDVLVEEIFSADLTDELTGYKARVFRSRIDGVEHLVLQKGDVTANGPTLVRVQNDNYTRDFFNLLRDQESTLQRAIQKINNEGSGILLLLRGSNRPQGLLPEIKSMVGEKASFEMDHRDYGIGAQILRSCGVHSLRLLSNKIEKRVGLKAYQLEIVEYVSLNDEDEEDESKNKEHQKKSTQNRGRHFPVQ